MRRAKAWRLGIPLFGLLALLGAVAAAASTLVARDDRGREVRLDQAPRRIVSLLPSLTETVCALDACDRLVATDRFSNWPTSVEALPKLGGLDDAEIEMIVSLKPDLVLLSRTQRISERLESLGLKAFALDTETYAAIAGTVTAVGRLIDTPDRAAQLIERIEREVGAVAAQARARRAGGAPRVYFEVDRTPYAASTSSFIGELLARLGTQNIVSADLGAFPKLNPEYIVRHDPDVIFIDATDVAGLAERPGWQTIRAVREHRICGLTPAVRDTIVRPGPRVAEGMRALEECLDRLAP